MVAKDSNKKKAPKKRAKLARPKRIDWDKYVGKIKFPDDFLASIRVMRNEWR